MLFRANVKMTLDWINNRGEILRTASVEKGSFMLHFPTARGKTRTFFLHEGKLVWASGWKVDSLLEARYIEKVE